MRAHVCPWWGGYFIDNRLRRWFQPPQRILAPYLQPGMVVLDFGCGMGFTAIPAARLLGDQGTVIAADLQPQMLDTLRRRATSAGVAERIHTHRCERDSLNLVRSLDFAWAFYSLHEVPDSRRILAEIHGLLRSGGRFLLVEPIGHVRASAFAETITSAEDAGFRLQEQPRIRLSHSAVLAKA